MDNHNWNNQYKGSIVAMFYRECYNCGVIEVRVELGEWEISIKSEFYNLYRFEKTPSCNELQMQRALG